VALVTGGGSGIGASIVWHLAQQESRVAFVDVDDNASNDLVSEIERAGGVRPLYLSCDLRDIDDLKAAVERVESDLGPVRVLVNNAARDDRHDIDSVTPDYWDERMAVNLRHQFFATQAVRHGMADAGGGSIINMGSIVWMVGMGGMTAYATAKSAVEGLTRSLADELGPENIRVNSVAPGWIMTQRQIDLWLTPEGEEKLMQFQTLKRKLMPEEVARVVLFLAADDSSACTNQTYVVDGGWL